jgi:hypothetical protein
MAQQEDVAKFLTAQAEISNFMSGLRETLPYSVWE